jgi:molybdopterin converting factor small subunit
MKIWITKYALTKGVRVCDGNVENKMATVKWPGGLNDKAYFHGSEFQLSEGAALERVREMIAAKRRALKSQLERLEDIERVNTLPQWLDF